jgi:hypothetical protein
MNKFNADLVRTCVAGGPTPVDRHGAANPASASKSTGRNVVRERLAILSSLRAPATAADPTCFHFQPRPGLTVKLDFATQSRDQCLYGGEPLFAERRARRDETAVLSLG